MKVKPSIVIVDTREQLPYWAVPVCRRKKLNVGDYTTTRLLNRFHIERKSLQDLYGTIIQHHARFRREVFRAFDSKTQLVVYVEGTKKQFINKKFPRGHERKIKSETLEKIINTIEDRYQLEIIWNSSRGSCKRAVMQRLMKEEKKKAPRKK